jgi:hypothetical protein
VVWNYRIVKTQSKGETLYGIHEVYYGDGEEEIPEGASQQVLDRLGHSWTENPCDVTSDDPSYLRVILQRMLLACDKPIVDGSQT